MMTDCRLYLYVHRSQCLELLLPQTAGDVLLLESFFDNPSVGWWGSRQHRHSRDIYHWQSAELHFGEVGEYDQSVSSRKNKISKLNIAIQFVKDNLLSFILTSNKPFRSIFMSARNAFQRHRSILQRWKSLSVSVPKSFSSPSNAAALERHTMDSSCNP